MAFVPIKERQSVQRALFTIGFVFNPGRLQRLDAYRRGETPSEFFYGALELEMKGIDIRMFEADPAIPLHWPCAAFNFLSGHGPPKLDGGVMQATRSLLTQLRECDVVVGTTGGHAFALAVWRSLGRLRAPIVGIQAGLLNYKINLSRRYSTVFFLRRMQSILFGESELELMYKIYPGIRGHMHVNQFGVDTSFWTPGTSTRSGYILAVGNDGRRDYPTLIEAAKRLDHPVILVTSQTLSKPLPHNVEHMLGSYANGVSDTELRDLYRGASCVVVPLKPTFQPSGQSVTLQAMACGRPVVLSDIQGIWSRKTVRDGETLLLTPPGDTGQLVHAIRCVMKNKEFAETLGITARKAVLQSATIQDFADRLLDVCGLPPGHKSQK